MEPLAALSVAGNVLQFVDFSQKIISRTLEIYKAVDGASPNNRHLETVVKDFLLLNARIPRVLSNEKVGKGLTSELFINTEGVDSVEKSLIGHNVVLSQLPVGGNRAGDGMASIAKACSEISNDLLHRLENLKASGKHRTWKSLKTALSSFSQESELSNLNRQLGMYKEQLEWHVMVSLREDVSLMSSRQADQFQSSVRTMETIKELLQMGGPSATTNSISFSTLHEFHNQSLRHVSAEHEKTCAAITGAIERAIENSGLGAFKISSLVEPSVTTNAATRFAKELLKIETDILESLRFPLMMDREEEIRQAERATFEWIYRNPRSEDMPWDNFAEWLQHGNNLYWITGKPGSGKSTLMKYLFCNIRSIDHLRWWSSGEELVVAGFFLWNSGGDLQKTQNGLLRSLLHQCLARHRELIPTIFSDLTHLTPGALTDIWTNTRLSRAFTALVQQKLVPMKLCFFIDGLDEYSGDHRAISEILKEVAATPNAKVCVSSRPLVVFERAFDRYPGLMLQNLTFEDIQIYVKHQFSDNRAMERLQAEEPSFGSLLALEITEKAAGVFLWVRLVVESLLQGIDNYDRSSDLLRRLRELPEDLEELYWHMLKMVKPAFYLEQASKMLLIVYNAKRPFTLLQLSYADLEDENRALNAKFMEIASDEAETMCRMMEGRLKSRCLGLIEVPTCASNSTSRTGRVVQFMHQSVADFIERSQVKKRMADCLRGHNFNPHICLMRQIILDLKHLPTKIHQCERQPGLFLAQVWFKRSWPLIEEFAKQASKAENEKHDPDIQLLDEFDRVAGYLWNSYLDAEARFRTRQGFHWSARTEEGDFPLFGRSNASFCSFLAQSGVRYAVRYYIWSGNKDTGRKPTNSELDYAISLVSKTATADSGIHQDLLRARGFSFRTSLKLLRDNVRKVERRKDSFSAL